MLRPRHRSGFYVMTFLMASAGHHVAVAAKSGRHGLHAAVSLEHGHHTALDSCPSAGCADAATDCCLMGQCTWPCLCQPLLPSGRRPNLCWWRLDASPLTTGRAGQAAPIFLLPLKCDRWTDASWLILTQQGLKNMNINKLGDLVLAPLPILAFAQPVLAQGVADC